MTGSEKREKHFMTLLWLRNFRNGFRNRLIRNRTKMNKQKENTGMGIFVK